MMVRSFIGPVLVSTLLSVLPAFASAGMIVQPVVKDSSNFFDDTIFDRFDRSLGTLTQVTLDIELSLTVSTSPTSLIFLPGFCVATGACAGDITLAVNGFDSLIPLSLSDAEPVTDAEADAGESVDLALLDSIDFSNLDDFRSPGGSPRLSTSVFAEGPFLIPAYSNESGSITLTYLFDDPVIVPSVSPIPEPAILVLFGLGLAGLGWARRKSSV